MQTPPDSNPSLELPSRASSSAPVDRSVSVRELFRNGRTKKRLTFAALSDLVINSPTLLTPDPAILTCRATIVLRKSRDETEEAGQPARLPTSACTGNYS